MKRTDYLWIFRFILLATAIVAAFLGRDGIGVACGLALFWSFFIELE